MRALIRFLRSLVRARHVADADLRDEFALHVDSRTDDLVRRGLSREAARRQARLEFGPVTAYEERVRDVHVCRHQHCCRGHASRMLERRDVFSIDLSKAAIERRGRSNPGFAQYFAKPEGGERHLLFLAAQRTAR